MNKQLKRRGFVRLWLMQLGVTLSLALACLLFFHVDAALSALLGGLVCIIPNIYFASRVFRYEGARRAKNIVNSIYKGEALKLVLSILLFATVFVVFKVTPLAFFVSYITVQMTHWLAPWIIVNKQNRPESD